MTTDGPRPQTTHFSGTTGDMDVVLEELRASMGADLYAEPLRAITLAVKIAKARQHATVRVPLATLHAGPLRDFLLWKAGRLSGQSGQARAEALRRIAGSEEISA
jgi:hypothetical protein